MHATVTEAEMLGMLIGLEDESSWIGLHNQRAKQRLEQVHTQLARSWIHAELQSVNKTGCTLILVSSYSGIEGNEAADRRAKIRAYGGRLADRASILTLAGIRPDHHIHAKPPHLDVTSKKRRGLPFIDAHRGPIRKRQEVMKGGDDPFCQCGEIQKVVHVTRCRLIADGEGSSPEQICEDRECCQEDLEFLD